MYSAPQKNAPSPKMSLSPAARSQNICSCSHVSRQKRLLPRTGWQLGRAAPSKQPHLYAPIGNCLFMSLRTLGSLSLVLRTLLLVQRSLIDHRPRACFRSTLYGVKARLKMCSLHEAVPAIGRPPDRPSGTEVGASSDKSRMLIKNWIDRLYRGSASSFISWFQRLCCARPYTMRSE